MTAILHYFHDPMCSWCYAFQPVWQEIKQELPAGLVPLYVLGGLAEDDDEAMPLSLQRSIQEHWQRIEQLTTAASYPCIRGTGFSCTGTKHRGREPAVAHRLQQFRSATCCDPAGLVPQARRRQCTARVADRLLASEVVLMQ